MSGYSSRIDSMIEAILANRQAIESIDNGNVAFHFCINTADFKMTMVGTDGVLWVERDGAWEPILFGASNGD